MILLCLFRHTIYCILGKLEITPRLHLFNHLYIMITIRIVFSANHKGLELFITCN